MLTSLRLRNFKSWRDTGDVRLAPITVLFGTNSSGKTSLLQLLLMLKQTAQSADRRRVLELGDARSLVELGTFQDLVFAHDAASSLEWDLSWTLDERLQVEDPSRRKVVQFEADALGFAAAVDWQGNGDGRGRSVVSRLEYRLAGHRFEMQLASPDKREYQLTTHGGDFKFVRTQGRAWPLPPPAKCYGFPDQVRAYFQNAGFLADLELQFERLFERIHYLGPLREYPKREYPWSGSQPADMGQRGEYAVDALLASRDVKVVYPRGKRQGRRATTVEQRVAQWLKALGLIDSFEVRPVASGSKLFQVWVRRHARASEVLITDVGFGVSQILPVITLCYYAPPGSTLILEQPEIHLHPAVQAGLADVLIDAARTRDLQLIVESHSEHLLRRLQRRIAEEALPSQDAAMYFCSTEGGESRLTALSLDMFGSIENWPEGFFGDEFAEIEATQTAIIRRKRATAT